LVFLLFSGCRDQSGSGSRIFDFGPVFLSETKKVQHTFVVTNPNRTPVSIKAIRKSCTCTEAVIHAKEILPGGEAKLEMTVDVKLGSRPWSIQCVLDTDDKTDPEWIYELRYRTYPPIRFEADTIPLETKKNGSVQFFEADVFVEQFSPDESTTGDELTLSTESRLLKWTKLESPVNSLLEAGRVKVRKTRYRLTVDEPSGNPGVHTASLSIKTPRGETASTVVSWTETSVLSVEPRSVFFGMLTDKQAEVQKTVRIKDTDQRPFQLLALGSHPEWLKAEFGKAEDEGKTQVLHLTLVVKAIPKDRRYLSDEISLETDHAEARKVRIPWSAILR
jgi:hypothetical protein